LNCIFFYFRKKREKVKEKDKKIFSDFLKRFFEKFGEKKKERERMEKSAPYYLILCNFREKTTSLQL